MFLFAKNDKELTVIIVDLGCLKLLLIYFSLLNFCPIHLTQVTLRGLQKHNKIFIHVLESQEFCFHYHSSRVTSTISLHFHNILTTRFTWRIYQDHFPHCYPQDFTSLCVRVLFKTGQESQCENNQEKNNVQKSVYFLRT